MSGVPVNSAVILNFPYASAVSISGSATSGSLGRMLDYDGRIGRWEEEGGCDRELTPDDRSSEPELSESQSRMLDYDAREGAWEWKGRGEQVDCTYWNQRGPIAREELEARILAAGGGMMKAVVSVDRRYASEIGMQTKEDFERLLRNTWVDGVMRWGVTDDPNNVDWYACYHTDHEKSLHVHVSTWLRDGSMPESFTVTARGTREHKMVLYREAYRPLRSMRNIEQSYVRSLTLNVAERALGHEPSRSEEDALQRRAAELGREVPTVERVPEEKLEMEVERLRASLAEGHGRLSRNFEAQSAARGVFDKLYAHSGTFKESVDEYRILIEVKADLNGLAVQEPEEGRELRPGQVVTNHERDRFIRRDVDDLKQRVCNRIIRREDPSAPMRAHVREISRDIRKGALERAVRREGGAMLQMPPGRGKWRGRTRRSAPRPRRREVPASRSSQNAS